ncbi:MAG: hypothetical protein KDA62_08255 [Planctomycetales bacterium]|nr:hypothetical protein [Planctomycetales bacterium]
MLVFISDLHFTDGTSSASVDAGAVELFAERLNDLAERASWRTGGQYKPIEQIDLVLLGDTIDLLRSSRWQETNARPWSETNSPAFIETVRKIVDGVLNHNATSLQYLRALASHGGIALAPASASGQPVFGAELVAVPVHIHYMVGNHDWMLRQRGAEYDAIRRKISQYFGLAHDGRQPFAHEPAEAGTLQEALRRHRVFARHGDVFDPLSFHQDRNESSVSDLLVIELTSHFLADVEQQLGEHLPAATLANLRELDHVRPQLFAPVWLESLLDRTCPSSTQRREIFRRWDAHVDRLLQSDVLRQWDNDSPHQLRDGLQRSLMFRKRAAHDWTSRTGDWLNSMRGAANASYWQHAIAEPEFRNRRAKYIVYGHTHQCETTPLEASYADGFALQQIYFNTGTWRRVYQTTRWQPAGHEFIPTETMSYLSFFAGDERGGRPFECWSGTLGALTPAASVHRLDVGRASHASPESVPTSNVPIARPHFASTPAAARASAAQRR